eukprot:m.60688 g.60688  ORF g.60688 m.60688 type:complete len:104 (+) comp9519_c0_seq2:134-445(+)
MLGMAADWQAEGVWSDIAARQREALWQSSARFPVFEHNPELPENFDVLLLQATALRHVRCRSDGGQFIPERSPAKDELPGRDSFSRRSRNACLVSATALSTTR